jgi:hypothetical protein
MAKIKVAAPAVYNHGALSQVFHSFQAQVWLELKRMLNSSRSAVPEKA